MDMRLDNPWNNAFAGEIDSLSSRSGRFQDFSVGPNGRESTALDRHGLCGGMIG
jgi:hypothetical protein